MEGAEAFFQFQTSSSAYNEEEEEEYEKVFC